MKGEHEKGNERIVGGDVSRSERKGRDKRVLRGKDRKMRRERKETRENWDRQYLGIILQRSGRQERVVQGRK